MRIDDSDYAAVPPRTVLSVDVGSNGHSALTDIAGFAGCAVREPYDGGENRAGHALDAQFTPKYVCFVDFRGVQVWYARW